MTANKYFPPAHAKGQYHCPHCGVYSKQRWGNIQLIEDAHSKPYPTGGYRHRSPICELDSITGILPETWTVSACEHCSNIAVWLGTKMIFPKINTVPQPNQDLNGDIQEDYQEAANVLTDSPRSAAAILRLALQKLCVQLGEPGKNINDDIGAMVKDGLNPNVQKSLDALRITGNNAVHPGELDVTDDVERVSKLFGLINFIADKMITEPKELEQFYNELPENARKAVEKRDEQ